MLIREWVAELQGDEPRNDSEARECDGTPYDSLVLVLAYSGIRLGEAAALIRTQCDLEGSRMRIGESLDEIAGKLHFATTMGTYLHHDLGSGSSIVDTFRFRIPRSPRNST